MLVYVELDMQVFELVEPESCSKPHESDDSFLGATFSLSRI